MTLTVTITQASVSAVSSSTYTMRAVGVYSGKIVIKRMRLHRSKIFRFLALSSRGGKLHIKNLFLSACYFPHTAPLAEFPLTPLN